MVGEPVHGAVKDADGGGGFLVGVDLGVGDAGVVVDDGVYERGPDPWPVLVAALSGAGAVAWLLILLCCRLRNLCPPPSGMLPNLVTSTWISEPG